MAHSCASSFYISIVSCASIIIVSAALSGLYVDNGLDQTVIQRVMTHREKLMVEREILDLLGLPARPKHSRNVPLNRSAPSFLLDVYKSLADERDQSRPTRSSHLSLSGDEQQAIDESDIIMTFQSKNHRGPSVRHERGRHLWFDVSDVPVDDTILAAELRLYQSVEYKSKQPNDIYTVSVQKIISIDQMGDLELELMSSINTSASNEGWIELNVTSAFAEWVALPSTNQGLLINVYRASNPDREYKLEDIGLVNTKGVDEKQPFMVAFFTAVSSLPGVKSSSSRRKRESRRRNKSEYGFSENYLRNPYSEPPSYRSSRSCQIQTLYVSFKDLEWQDWIIAPDGYGAFYCSGECNFPLNAHMNATNHAIVQTLVHLLNPTQVPKACCAPTKLTAISVLYFQDDSNVTLKKYKNMVVKSCGCH